MSNHELEDAGGCRADQGIMLLMAENARGDLVWNAVMGAPEVRRAMTAVGLQNKSLLASA